jgi:competence protein ComGC
VGLILLFIMMIVVLAVMVILLMIWLPSILAAHGILSGLGCFGFALRLPRAVGPAKEITHDGLHPLWKRGKALAQVVADGGTMSWIL